MAQLNTTTITGGATITGDLILNEKNIETVLDSKVDSSKIIDSLDDIMANTTEGMPAGSLAIAELNNKLNEVVLYENEKGIRSNKDKTTIKLNDAVANYKYIEIYYGNDINSNDIFPQSYQKNPVDKTGKTQMRLLFCGGSNTTNTIEQFTRANAYLHDSICEFSGEKFINFSSTAGTVKWAIATTCHMLIFKIVGLKE